MTTLTPAAARAAGPATQHDGTSTPDSARGLRTPNLTPFAQTGSPLRVWVVDETIVVHGPLVSTTVSLVLAFVMTCEERGLIEIGLDLGGITALDYEAIVALAHAQQHANRAGRQLRISTSNSAMRLALTGCHLEP